MHLSFPKLFPLFILASSVCKSLQCLISTLTQGGKGGHLFRLTCSVVLWGGRDTANNHHWHVWGVLAVYAPHCTCPSSRCRVLHEFTLLSLQGALQGYCPKWALRFVNFPGLSCSGSWVLHKGTDLFGEHFVPFPGSSSSGDQVLGKCTVPCGLCVLITSPVLASWCPRCATGAPSQVCHVGGVSPLGS